jgi:dynein heavy chain 1
MTSAQPSFRLFLIMETSPAIPVSILRQGHVLMNEAAPGLRANVLELMRFVPQQMLSSGPSEKGRIFFLLCWLHAVLIQRLRYVPLAFSKAYEFNDADFKAALGRLDLWINAAAKSKTNVDPENLPWLAMRFIMRDYAMGGRIDTTQDLLVLDSLIKQLFNPGSFELAFSLTGSEHAGEPFELRLEDERSWQSFHDFISQKLPEMEDPRVLGLPATAAQVIAVKEAEALVTALRNMRAAGSVHALASADVAEDAIPRWMTDSAALCGQLLEGLPKVRRWQPSWAPIDSESADGRTRRQHFIGPHQPVLLARTNLLLRCYTTCAVGSASRQEGFARRRSTDKSHPRHHVRSRQEPRP